MQISVNCTNDGVITYPLHSHADYEIIYYLQGEGALKTERGDYPYKPGTIIIVPQEILHGSTSKTGFKNICVSGDFRKFLSFADPVVLQDNAAEEGKAFAEMIYANRHFENEFFVSLCETYVLFLLTNVQEDGRMDVVVKNIIAEISERACDSTFRVSSVLSQSGYAPDYIRAQFKCKTGKTPTRFMTEIRIDRACFFMDIYKDTRSLTEIAEQCGFLDYVQFSKRFKQVKGISPTEYKKRRSSIR